MKKKDTEKLNNALYGGIDVPDSVLDAARVEMKNNAAENASPPVPTQKRRIKASGGGTAVAVNKKIIAVCCACAVFAVCLVVIMAAMFMRTPFDAKDAVNTYYITDMEKVEITSLDQYNEENNTEYIFVPFEGTTTYAYTDDENIVLFTQTFTYGQTEYIWYIAVNESDEFDILQNYIETDDFEETGGYTVYYGNADKYYAKFYSGGNAYYLTGDCDNTTIAEILKLIIE